MWLNLVTGLQGSGKSFMLVREAWKERRRNPNGLIVANFPIYLPGRRVLVCDSLDACYKLTNCLVLLDELHFWCGAREWNRFGLDRREWISQLRKRKVRMWYATHYPSAIDKEIRERTDDCYFLTSWRALGFFTYLQWHCQPDHIGRLKGIPGWFFLSPKVGGLYKTDHILESGV